MTNSSSLPSWMRATDGAENTATDASTLPGVTAVPARLWHRRFLRRSLAAFARLLAELLSHEDTAARPGLLQRIEPRAKILGLIGLLVTTTLLHRLPQLAVVLAAGLLLSAASRLPWRQLAAAWLAVPLFSAAIMLPATLNWITPGTPLLTLWHFADSATAWPAQFGLPPVLSVTDTGLHGLCRFVLRLTTCLTLAKLLVATTRPDQLFRGLRSLGMPKLFVMLLGMMERYLTLLLQIAGEMHLARISRSIVPGAVRDEQAWVAAGIGTLFRRTWMLGHAIYLAMIARGYTGESRLLAPARWHWPDTLFIAACAALAAALLRT